MAAPAAETPPEPLPSTDPFGDYRAVGPLASLRKAQEWLFVLRAVGLGGLVRSAPEGCWYVLVLAEDYDRVLATLGAYEEENRPEPLITKRDVPSYASSSAD